MPTPMPPLLSVDTRTLPTDCVEKPYARPLKDSEPLARICSHEPKTVPLPSTATERLAPTHTPLSTYDVCVVRPRNRPDARSTVTSITQESVTAAELGGTP